MSSEMSEEDSICRAIVRIDLGPTYFSNIFLSQDLANINLGGPLEYRPKFSGKLLFFIVHSVKYQHEVKISISKIF